MALKNEMDYATVIGVGLMMQINESSPQILQVKYIFCYP